MHGAQDPGAQAPKTTKKMDQEWNVNETIKVRIGL